MSGNTMSEQTPGPELYRRTLAKWGEAAQYEQMVEECAELIACLKHYQRGKRDALSVIEELADVRLMLGQLSYMFGQDQVAAAEERKLAKLERLLAKQEDEENR